MNPLKLFLALVLSVFSMEANSFWIGAGDIGLTGPIHQAITKEALNQVVWEQHIHKFKFQPDAIEKIIKENKKTDQLQKPYLHFDDESNLANRYLFLRKDYIEDDLEPSLISNEMAFIELGMALHTIQDFYSHSTWVERKNTEINPVLGTGVDIFNTSLGDTCSDNDDDFILFDGKPALTSGYYKVEREGKCSHGGILSFFGIHKDHTSRSLYKDARGLAVKATKDYLEKLIGQLQAANKYAEICILMGIPDVECPIPLRIYAYSLYDTISIPVSVYSTNTYNGLPEAPMRVYPGNAYFQPAYGFGVSPVFCKTGGEWMPKTATWNTKRDKIPATNGGCTVEGTMGETSNSSQTLSSTGRLKINRTDIKAYKSTTTCPIAYGGVITSFTHNTSILVITPLT